MRNISNTARIDVHVELIEQLFNSIDPSPFHARDLDSQAQDYIVEAARELPKKDHLELLIHLDVRPAESDKLTHLERAIQTHFSVKATSARRLLKELFARGRISLVIGLSFLTLFIVIVELTKGWSGSGGMGQILHLSLLIGGWVAMWRPMEIFLYDWWPIATQIRLFDRLAKIEVRVLTK